MIQGTYLLKSHSDQVRLDIFLNQHRDSAYADGQPLVVRVSQKQDTLTDAQRRLYWLWMTEYGNAKGFGKDEAADFFKYKYLSIIFNRDNVGEYPETFGVIRELKSTGASQYEILRSFVVSRMSIREANIKQMAEFLNDIELFCIKDGVKLTCPDDLKWVVEN